MNKIISLENYRKKRDDEVFAAVNGAENFYWYATDIRGSSSSIVKSDSTANHGLKRVRDFSYDAYGNTADTLQNTTDTEMDEIAYTGGVFDKELGLYYLMSRYYDPAIAQFISEDSYRGDGEHFWNLYMYCEGDPINRTDRNGEYGLWRADVKKLNKSKKTAYGAAPSTSYLKKNQSNWISANCFGYAIRINRNLKLIAGMEKITSSKTKNVDCWFNAVVNYIKKYNLARWVRRLTGASARIYSNEWRVALRCSTRSSNGYEDYQTYDYHFMIQQSNGKWSDKHSETNTVHYNHTSLSKVKTWSGTFPNNDRIYDSKIIYFAVCNKKPKGA